MHCSQERLACTAAVPLGAQWRHQHRNAGYQLQWRMYDLVHLDAALVRTRLAVLIAEHLFSATTLQQPPAHEGAQNATAQISLYLGHSGGIDSTGRVNNNSRRRPQFHWLIRETPSLNSWNAYWPAVLRPSIRKVLFFPMRPRLLRSFSVSILLTTRVKWISDLAESCWRTTSR